MPSPLPPSAVPGLRFPSVPAAGVARLLALAFQLDQTARWRAEALREAQLRQLELLVAHAARTSPAWRERLDAVPGLASAPALGWDLWRRLPVLGRAEVQALGERLRSARVPPEHGGVFVGRTSGSTGRPVTTWHTGAEVAVARALRLRHFLAHDLDLALPMADVRAHERPPADEGWAPGLPSGPLLALDVRTPPAAQLAWLAERRPGHLLTHPSNLELLLAEVARGGPAPDSLRAVHTFGEVLLPAVRRRLREDWGIAAIDAYSSVEVPVIALQCPRAEHLHVQSEAVLVEILDEAGEPCAPGQAGRVVVTPLHGFAMPLLRYDLGDVAEVGEPCACGRAHPVIRRVVGRPREMLVRADGSRAWPVHPDELARLPSLRRFAYAQPRPGAVRVRFEADSPLDERALAWAVAAVARALGEGFEVEGEQAAIPPGPGGKRARVVPAGDAGW